MKKILKVFMFILCLCPLILLSACTPPQKYTISSMSSDPMLGSVQGTINGEVEEGNKVTLVAKELDGKIETNPFICWVKDYRSVVSSSKNLTLTYNSKTAGHYTAVFAEDSPTKMRFASLSSISFESQDYSSANYQILYAVTSTGSNNYNPFINGNVNTNAEIKTDNKTIVYFGSVDANNEYNFNVKVKMLNSQNIETEYEFQINTLLSSSSFDSEGKCTISQTVEAINTTITLVFEKLNSDMFKS